MVLFRRRERETAMLAEFGEGGGLWSAMHGQSRDVAGIGTREQRVASFRGVVLPVCPGARVRTSNHPSLLTSASESPTYCIPSSL